MKIMEEMNDCEISSEYECPLQMQLHNLLCRYLTGSTYSGSSDGLSYQEIVSTFKTAFQCARLLRCLEDSKVLSIGDT